MYSHAVNTCTGCHNYYTHAYYTLATIQKKYTISWYHQILFISIFIAEHVTEVHVVSQWF